MPRFDFRCRECKNVFEEKTVHSLSMCPKCGALADKQPAAPAFSIKGYSAKNGYSKEGR